MNIHSLRDEIIRKRNELIVSLNNLYESDKEAGVLAYQLCIQQIALYFKGSEPEEDVQEKAGE